MAVGPIPMSMIVDRFQHHVQVTDIQGYPRIFWIIVQYAQMMADQRIQLSMEMKTAMQDLVMEALEQI